MTDSKSLDQTSAHLHRRRGYAINAPALLRHVCYRMSDSTDTKQVKSDFAVLSAEQQLDTRAEVAFYKLNIAIAQIQIAGQAERKPDAIFQFSRRKAAPIISPEDKAAAEAKQRLLKPWQEKCTDVLGRHQIKRIPANESLLCRLTLNAPVRADWRARMHVDVNQEYSAVTFVLDQADRKADASTAAARSNLEKLDELGAAFLVDFETDCAKAAPLQNFPAGYDALTHKLYETVWDEFDTAIKRAVGSDVLPPEPFADFRGVVLGSGSERLNGSLSAAVPAKGDFLAPPLTAPQIRRSKNALCDWVKTNSKFMDAVLQLDDSSKDGLDQDANSVLCTFLLGRGIYASSLGRLPPAADKPASHGQDDASEKTVFAPEQRRLRYIVLHRGLSRFQLGRILGRLQGLGELRLAARFDLSSLRDADNKIRALEDDITKQLRLDAVLNLAGFNDALKNMNALTSSEIEGGLLYRVNRGRGYAQDFKIRMDDMLFERVEGWEPYHLFMRRNVFPLFEFIDGIGLRYDTLAQLFQRLTTSLLQQRANEVSTRILHIQDLGELIGWGAFTYYAGHIVDGLLEWLGEIVCERPADDLIGTCQFLHNKNARLVFGFAVAYCLFWGIREYWRKVKWPEGKDTVQGPGNNSDVRPVSQ